MQRSGGKNSLLDGAVAQEMLKIFSMRRICSKILLFDGAAPAQKVRRFSPICQCARATRCLMPRRAIGNRDSAQMLAVCGEFAAFCAFETGI